jgi:hypothetical protein
LPWKLENVMVRLMFIRFTIVPERFPCY